MNCKGDDDIDAKRSRPSIGKPGKTYAQKERVNLIGNDQRITSGPAVKRPHSKAEYMTAPERLADSQFFSCTGGRRPYMMGQRVLHKPYPLIETAAALVRFAEEPK